MTDSDRVEQSHKKTAMKFLLSSNDELENPISSEIIEKVYDLFSEEQSGSQSYQRMLEKLINT
tara:strand:+ start:1312 stop:1500 length:189 start_codon:yes stop_codon:yes gene_type:complete